jgi:hypothetical protein
MALELRIGTEKFLVSKLNGILTAANAAIVAQVQSTAAVPVFTVRIGEIPNPASPILSVAFAGAPAPVRNGDGLIFRTVQFKIFCYIPLAGDCSPMNYEMAGVVMADYVDTLLLDDSQMQLITINAGQIPKIVSYGTDVGQQMTLWPMKLADGVTTVHGWMLPWSATYSIRTK